MYSRVGLSLTEHGVCVAALLRQESWRPGHGQAGVLISTESLCRVSLRRARVCLPWYLQRVLASATTMCTLVECVRAPSCARLRILPRACPRAHSLACLRILLLACLRAHSLACLRAHSLACLRPLPLL